MKNSKQKAQKRILCEKNVADAAPAVKKNKRRATRCQLDTEELIVKSHTKKGKKKEDDSRREYRGTHNKNAEAQDYSYHNKIVVVEDKLTPNSEAKNDVRNSAITTPPHDKNVGSGGKPEEKVRRSSRRQVKIVEDKKSKFQSENKIAKVQDGFYHNDAVIVEDKVTRDSDAKNEVYDSLNTRPPRDKTVESGGESEGKKERRSSRRQMKIVEDKKSKIPPDNNIVVVEDKLAPDSDAKNELHDLVNTTSPLNKAEDSRGKSDTKIIRRSLQRQVKKAEDDNSKIQHDNKVAEVQDDNSYHNNTVVVEDKPTPDSDAKNEVHDPVNTMSPLDKTVGSRGKSEIKKLRRSARSQVKKVEDNNSKIHPDNKIVEVQDNNSCHNNAVVVEDKLTPNSDVTNEVHDLVTTAPTFDKTMGNRGKSERKVRRSSRWQVKKVENEKFKKQSKVPDEDTNFVTSGYSTELLPMTTSNKMKVSGAAVTPSTCKKKKTRSSNVEEDTFANLPETDISVRRKRIRTGDSKSLKSASALVETDPPLIVKKRRSGKTNLQEKTSVDLDEADTQLKEKIGNSKSQESTYESSFLAGSIATLPAAKAIEVTPGNDTRRKSMRKAGAFMTRTIRTSPGSDEENFEMALAVNQEESNIDVCDNIMNVTNSKKRSYHSKSRKKTKTEKTRKEVDDTPEHDGDAEMLHDACHKMPRRKRFRVTKSGSPSSENTTSLTTKTQKEDYVMGLAIKRYCARIASHVSAGTVNIILSGVKGEVTTLLKVLGTVMKEKKVALNIQKDVNINTTTLCISPKLDSGILSKFSVGAVRTMKVMRSHLAGIPILSPEWIETCLQAKKIADPSKSHIIWALKTKREELFLEVSSNDVNPPAILGVARMAGALEQCGNMVKEANDSVAVTKQCKERDNQLCCLPLLGMAICLLGDKKKASKDRQSLLQEGGGTFVPNLTIKRVQGISDNKISSKMLVLLFDNNWEDKKRDKNGGLSENLWLQIETIIDSVDGRAKLLIADSGWLFDSISCGRALEMSRYCPNYCERALKAWSKCCPKLS
uniref:BRCT domain-containing protein n=1 Tax=Corethron hystrix TaxID=216773 RepID=A0A7S1C2M0_9STRA